MEALALSLAVLIGSHVIPSAPGVRDRLLAIVGRRAFYIAYSIVSLAALAAVIWAYRAADPSTWLWTPAAGARLLAVLLMPVAILLVVCRLTTRPDPADARGIYRITCVPGSLGILLWAVLHLANVGAARTVMVFASMAVIAGFALVKNAWRASIDQRRAGILPFAGILRGRQHLSWREIGWGRFGLAVALYLTLLLLHPIVIGPDPLAGLL